MEELIFAAFITSEDRSSIYPFSRTAVYSNCKAAIDAADLFLDVETKKAN